MVILLLLFNTSTKQTVERRNVLIPAHIGWVGPSHFLSQNKTLAHSNFADSGHKICFIGYFFVEIQNVSQDLVN